MFIVVGGLEIPILLKTKRQMKDNLGCFDGETEAIHILKDLTPAMRRKTLIHECFHAFLFVTGYNELLSDVSDNFEEAITRAFEQAFVDKIVFSTEIEAWIKG